MLVARRAPKAHQGGLLEFPGGKLEPGEAVTSALARELFEELGVTIDIAFATPLIGIYHDYPDKRVYLDVWDVPVFSGEPVQGAGAPMAGWGREGQAVAWMPVHHLSPQEFPAANLPIIRALQLPRQLLITPACLQANAADVTVAFSRYFERFLQRQPGQLQQSQLILLRAPGLSAEAYALRLRALQAAPAMAGHRLLLHGLANYQHCQNQHCQPAAASEPDQQLRIAGVHLPWADAQPLQCRPVAQQALFGVSCHNMDQLTHAARLGADYATLSPVATTISHPQAQPLGWALFSQMARAVELPVYALGGLGLDEVEWARRHGAQGVAAIGDWWPQGA